MNIRLDTLDHNVYRLTFDRADSPANIFDRATMEELQAHLQSLSGDTMMNGLILASAKDSIFIAGADIKELLAEGLKDDELLDLVRRGQKVFNQLADLRVPTVAAIHGACLGGGLELCLACDYRLASNDKSTRIGLPETSLGILPAWGGCTRLPRLIGLPRALDLILGGKRLAPKQAKTYGVVDAVMPREHLLRMAMQKIAEGKPASRTSLLVNHPLAAAVIARKAGAAASAKTRGQYPAIPRALGVVTAGLRGSVDKSLELEANALVDLVKTEACRNLVRVFFLQERAKKLKVDQVSWLAASAESVERAVAYGRMERTAVIGAGVMGAGIAQWISSRGTPVILRDINPEQVRKGLAEIARSYREGVKRYVFTPTEARQGLERVHPAAEEVPLDRVDLVIEAAVEKMEIKQEIFRKLDQQVSDRAILATNTSALSITELAAATENPGRVLGLHFFNPVARMQLVEIVVGDQTEPGAVGRVLKFVQRIGKLPVVVKDRPGFLVNRILMPYLIEAGHLFTRGAEVEQIDGAMLDFGMPMGPLRLLDEVGLDVAHHVAAFFASAFGERMPLPEVLGRMVEAGLLGRKSGKGFYLYAGRGDPAPNRDMAAFVAASSASGFRREDLTQRMTLTMINEAARCLEEGVVTGPEDVDFGMIMGTGFAPFRGGPLRYADSLGMERVAGELTQLAAEHSRFAPCKRLRDMVDTDEKFYQERL